MDPQRAAWLRKYATQREPWRGPVHAAPLLAGLRGRVVELGAGGGKVGAALAADALALDWAALPPGRPGALADVRALPLRDASVDALVAIHVLGHLDAPERALAEWARVLRPGGAVVLEVFAAGDARDVAGHVAEREGVRTRFFEAEELRALLRAAGLEGDVTPEERALRWGTRRVLRALVAKPFPAPRHLPRA
ncbi:MAG TPA: methyltransferase domain-containing protein [Candidatus Thermoplasmatota archaeon]|nr:methyltransferase domain-containing protein [Candidatus Thermoplasmatota archaeon]